VVAVALVPFVLILLEPDLGTSLSLPAAVLPMLYWAGLPLVVVLALASPILTLVLLLPARFHETPELWIVLWFVFLAGLGWFLLASRVRRATLVGVLGFNMVVGSLVPVLWSRFLQPYQQLRVKTLWNPAEDPLGAGYQAHQSKIAIGSGGFLGKGYLEGTQKGLAFLPHTHTDFIFSILGEEFGFVGCMVTLLLFALLVGRGLMLATRARSRFAGTLAAGISSMILFHVAVNVSMTIGLAPVTGLPLPFLSYGGTFLLLTLAQAGLLVNVSLRRNEV
jgi:rod shape determining protein RodA